jgi:hypothetical protein
LYCARLVQFKLGTGRRIDAERITKEFDKISRGMYGFRGNVYFFDDSVGEYRALNYWDTKKHAEQAHEILFPKLESKLETMTKEKPTYKFFEVFDPSDDGDLLYSHIRI